jgi:hypothetical protein
MAIRERSRFPAIGAAYYRARNKHGMQQLAAWLARMHAKQFLRVEDPMMAAEFVLTMVASERQRMLALGMEAPQSPEQLAGRIAAVLKFLFGEKAV